ncbi:MAG: SRPBCC domain-containing protein [Cyanobacteria bacterium J06638_7]
MKMLTYSIVISKPQDVVFKTMTDKSVYPGWAKAWGEGMTYEGEWKQGEHISFFDQTQGGTKVLVEEIVPNESIKTKHVAMVNQQNIEIELADDMMRKWIGSQENYYFKEKSENETTLEVVMITDEAFEKMMEAWPKALQLLKEICEA